jgi:hypothetical protein
MNRPSRLIPLAVAVFAICLPVSSCNRPDPEPQPEKELPAIPESTPSAPEQPSAPLPSAAEKSGPTDARVVPVSGGDAVIEPWFDPALKAWAEWKLRDGGPTQAKATTTWANVNLNWRAPAAGAGPVLVRDYAGGGIVLGPYSHLVLSAGFPKGTKVTLRAKTDVGPASKEFLCEVGSTDQFVMPLPGAKRLLGVEVALAASAPGAVEANLLWLGLRDSSLTESEAARWKLFSDQPMDVFLRDTPEPADAAPICNLLAPRSGFEQARKEAGASEAGKLALESAITLAPHLGGANQNLFGRRTGSPDRILQTFSTTDADGKKSVLPLLQAAQKASLAGDKEALREVAKAAVQIALIPHWDVDFVTEFPGSTWTQRCFAQAQVCYVLAVAADLAGSWLTDAGRDIILRRLAEDGLGNINYIVWRYPYIFECNQLPVFSVGRLAAYSVLEKQPSWGHVKPYTELAFAELNESLAQNFLPDGGFPEGTGYLGYTLSNALPALAIYGNARNRPLRELLPPLLAKTDNYLEALRSTEKPENLILVSDASGGPFTGLSRSALSVIAKIRPGGAAARLLASMAPGQGTAMELWALPTPDLTGVAPDFFEPFVLMPDTGIASSARKIGDRWSKLLAIGGPAGAGHNHEDRGSFVLEFAGETFAADPGGISYSDTTSAAMKHAQHHNMLVPAAKTGERPAAKNRATVAVVPVAKGDATSFNATLDAGVLWPDYYKSWQRSFNSPSPQEIVITDDYALLKGDGVEFLWHTPLPVQKVNGLVIISGKRGKAIITPPAGSTIEITPSRKLGMRNLSTIRFRQEAKSGRLQTKIRLEPTP